MLVPSKPAASLSVSRGETPPWAQGTAASHSRSGHHFQALQTQREMHLFVSALNWVISVQAGRCWVPACTALLR